MANSSKDGQAPARRIGGCVAIVAILIGCSCLAGLWYVFAGDSIDVLQTSLKLQTGGETTTGTVVDVEQFSGVKPNSNTTFKLFVEYTVDGQTYTIQSIAYYPTRSSSWVGESMPVIYDPADPDRYVSGALVEPVPGCISLLTRNEEI